MKKIMIVAVMTAMTLGAFAGTVAQDGKPADKKQMIEHRVEMMDKELSLTKKQKKKITNILTEEMKDMPERGMGRPHGGPHHRPGGMGGRQFDGKARAPHAGANGQRSAKDGAEDVKQRPAMPDSMMRKAHGQRQGHARQGNGGDKRHDEMAARREAVDKKILEVLTPEQQVKYTEMQKRHAAPKR